MTPIKSTALLALGGLLIGVMLGSIAAGLYASLMTGRDPTQVGFTTILDFFPPDLRMIPNREPI